MIPSKTDFPFSSQSHGWTPIELFDHEANYASDPFLVYLPDGRWNEAWIGDEQIDGRTGFLGEWRFIEVLVPLGGVDVFETAKINAMEPIAFMVITAPDLGELKQIVERKAA